MAERALFRPLWKLKIFSFQSGTLCLRRQSGRNRKLHLISVRTGFYSDVLLPETHASRFNLLVTLVTSPVLGINARVNFRSRGQNKRIYYMTMTSFYHI